MTFGAGSGLFGGGGGDAIGVGGLRIGVITSGLKQQTRKAVNEFTNELSKAEDGARTAGRRTSQAWERAFGLMKVAAVGAGVAIAGGLAASAQAAISFESAFAGVRKTVDFGNVSAAESEKRFAALSDEFRALAKEIPIGVNELAAIGEQAGALGIAADDIREFTRIAALIGVTTNVSADQAATALGQLSNVLGLTQGEYSRFASTLVDLGNKGASTEAQILEMASRAGGSAKLIGFAADETLAWASAVADLGIEVEAGGSAMQNLFLKAQQVMNDKDGLAVMAKAAGVTGKAFKKAFETDASGALLTFVKGLSKMTAGNQLAVLKDLGFDDIRMSRMLLGLAGNTDGLTASLNTASEAWEANTALQVEAEKRFATTASQIQLLMNVVKDLFIGIGTTLLPGINAVVKGLAESLPKAAKFLESVWNTTLAPAVGRLAEAFGGFWDAIRQVFGSDDEAASFGDVVKSAFGGIAHVLAIVLDVTASVFDVLSKLLSNPVIALLAKLTAGFIAFRIAVGGGKFAVDKLNGATRGFLRLLTGGRLGANPVGPDDAGSAALKGAAGQLGGSAGQLNAAAAALRGAAGAQRLGGVGGGNMGGPLKFVDRGDPNGIGTVNGQQTITQMMNTPEARAYALRHRRALDAAGKGIVRQSFAAMGDSMAAAGRSIKSIPGGAMRALGMAANLFWPLAIGGLALQLAGAPIGEFLAKNTTFKRVGAKMKEDFFGGLIDLVKAWQIGSDLFVDLPEMNLGGTKVQTDTLGNFDITPEQVAALQQGGLAGQLAGSQISPEVATRLKRFAGESLRDWAYRIMQDLKANGIDTSAIASNLSNLRGFWDAEGNAALDQQLTRLTNDAVSNLTTTMMSGTAAALRQGVVDAVTSVTGGTIPLGTLTTLSPETYAALADMLVTDAAAQLDPVVRALIIGKLTKPKEYEPPKAGTGYPFQTRPTEMDWERENILSAEEALKQFYKDLAELEPEKEKARQFGLQVLDWMNEGVAAAGKDPAAQAKFLASVNEMLVGQGMEPFVDWTSFINWRTTLSESTGEAAKNELRLKMKNWSVAGARLGATEGAMEFWNHWGPAIAAADTTEEKEALRRKFNELIPGEADDISKAEFAKWLLDMETKALAETEEQAGSKLAAWVGGLLTEKETAVTLLTSSMVPVLGDAVNTAVADKDLLARLWIAGQKIIKAITGSWTPTSLSDKLSAPLEGLKGKLPASPVRSGPLKHPFLFNAGRNIISQIGEGMQRSSLTVPDLDLGGARGGKRGGSTIYADKLQVLGPADERSLIERFAFLENN